MYSLFTIHVFRCNGHFELVLEEKDPEYPEWIGGCLLGMSGDNIAYVTQACDPEGVSIFHSTTKLEHQYLKTITTT